MRCEAVVLLEDLTPFLHTYVCNRFGEYLVIYETDYPSENQILFHVICRENTKANVSLTDMCN